jgi:hypothetical protein
MCGRGISCACLRTDGRGSARVLKTIGTGIGHGIIIGMVQDLEPKHCSTGEIQLEDCEIGIAIVKTQHEA